MSTRFRDLPPLGRSILFVVAMVLLQTLTPMVAGAMSAAGDPSLLAAVERADALGSGGLDILVALLPAAAVADLAIARLRGPAA